MSSRSAFNGRRTGGAFLWATLFLCVAAGLVLADENLADRVAAEVRRVFDERRSAVVRIEAFDRHGRVTGTGFFADPAGTIYTLASVVANADTITVQQGGRKWPAKLLVADPRSGIALIKVQCESPFIPPGASSKLSLASPVLTIGYPMEMDVTPSFGIVGGFDRKFLGKYFVTTHLRANLPVQPGFGGAPLLDLDGNVVGILIAGINEGSACYALPIEATEKIRVDFARFGAPRPGWVGVKVEESSTPGDDARVRIAELGPDTPASQAGLKAGDILLRVGTVRITTAEDVIDASFFLTSGDPVAVEILRDGVPTTVTVRSGTHPVMETRELTAQEFDSLTESLRLGVGGLLGKDPVPAP